MAKFKYSKKIEAIWEKTPYCSCGNDDCSINNHRLCNICWGKILYGSHESVESQRNSRYAWNIDHIVHISKGGSNSINNLQAVHIRCNRDKKNK